ncbi:hypothetical protein K2Z83_24380 [Oscillochloris sp. ZM17-4]|uniref:hypothetical protein n=1 Tax=Oscillochloris sp. ZM17-4 TaxID=2866714 RepID=UPI001C72AFE8|nr:hypothetical protein [Oscillochloris sp. ZM17-4]MBX0330799.1 hypothetical protein [Oscillochloris sp. ZM17-4]
MINLLYYSHTVVPAHLEELETLGLLERDEQVLVALDGVLLDSAGHRLSGPTLHDYCLVTTLRIMLWARDYGGHTCYAFPLAELESAQGTGLDPLHAQIALTFLASDDEDDEQSFTLTLLPLASLQAALTLIRSAAGAARELIAAGVSAREAGPEILSVLGEQIYGHVDGTRPGETPYRWPGAPVQPPLTPAPGFAQDAASLPPEKIYAAGRLARSAWDALRRSLREAELPFDLNNTSLRELTDTVRAVNDLVQTVTSNPAAQQMAMAFINRQGGRGTPSAPESPVAAATAQPEEMPAPVAGTYHEIPLRRREDSVAAAPMAAAAPKAAATVPKAAATAPKAAPQMAPDRREIPLRRRGPASANPRPFPRAPIPISGSGDADVDDGR